MGLQEPPVFYERMILNLFNMVQKQTFSMEAQQMLYLQSHKMSRKNCTMIPQVAVKLYN